MARNRFIPSLEGLGRLVLPSVFLPPVDTTLDDGILMDVDDPEPEPDPDGNGDPPTDLPPPPQGPVLPA